MKFIRKFYDTVDELFLDSPVSFKIKTRCYQLEWGLLFSTVKLEILTYLCEAIESKPGNKSV